MPGGRLVDLFPPPQGKRQKRHPVLPTVRAGHLYSDTHLQASRVPSAPGMRGHRQSAGAHRQNRLKHAGRAPPRSGLQSRATNQTRVATSVPPRPHPTGPDHSQLPERRPGPNVLQWCCPWEENLQLPQEQGSLAASNGVRAAPAYSRWLWVNNVGPMSIHPNVLNMLPPL